MRLFLLLFVVLLQAIHLKGQVDSCLIFPDQEIIILQTECDEPAIFCTNVMAAAISDYQFRNRGRIIQASEDCDFDTLQYYSLRSSVVLVGSFAPFFVDRWQVNDDFFSGSFSLIPQLIDSLNTWDTGGNWTFDEQTGQVIGGNTNNRYGDLLIEILLLNTSANFPYVIELTSNGRGIRLPVGNHLLTVRSTDAQCLDTIAATVVCTTTDTLFVGLEVNQTKTVCLDTSEFAGSRREITLVDNNQNFEWTALGDGCLQFTGRTISNDTSQFITCDEFGVCDTTFLIYTITNSSNRFRQANIRVGESGRFCINPRTIGLPGEITLFNNACRDATSGKAGFAFDMDGLCMRYQGLEAGKDSVCVFICDNFGNCDTIDFRLQVVEPTFVKDTILTNFDTVTYCLDISNFAGRSITLEEDCRNNYEQEIITYEIDPKTFCITYVGVQDGCDSLCLWLTDELGEASLTVLQICAGQPQPSTISQPIYVNETIEICVDTTELPGRIIEYFNFCPLASGDAAEFFIHKDNCIEITGLELGKEQACLVVCDDLGFCDTTYVIADVIPYPFLPDAVNDTTTTTQENSIIIPVNINDDLTGGGTSVRIASPPNFGTAIVNDDGSITYFPDAQSCRGIDKFSYLLCNANGCDNAEVTVEVQCQGIEIFTGFSPNGDGINDYFFIANIEANPLNTLQIFNKWGNLIYETERYQNDWDGRWNNKLLPDGTYYYLLEIEEDGNKNVYRGSIELQR